MNSIKLIALDIDGTIYNHKSDKKVSLRVVNAIKNATKKGIKVCLCTGRWHHIMKEFYPLFDNNNLHVSCNGSVIINHDGKVFYKKSLNQSHVFPLLSQLDDLSLGYGICDEHHIYANPKAFYEDMDHNTAILFNKKEQFYDLSYMSKLYINASGTDTQKVEELLKPLDFMYTIDNNKYFDIWPKNSDKGTGLLYLANHWNIPMDAIMFIGDGDNDIEALKIAGVSIAMGQAKPHVKNVAKIIAPEYTEDGVAWAIENYVL